MIDEVPVAAVVKRADCPDTTVVFEGCCEMVIEAFDPMRKFPRELPGIMSQKADWSGVFQAM